MMVLRAAERKIGGYAADAAIIGKGRQSWTMPQFPPLQPAADEQSVSFRLTNATTSHTFKSRSIQKPLQNHFEHIGISEIRTYLIPRDIAHLLDLTRTRYGVGHETHRRRASGIPGNLETDVQRRYLPRRSSPLRVATYRAIRPTRKTVAVGAGSFNAT
jgi:hypothetical protein